MGAVSMQSRNNGCTAIDGARIASIGAEMMTRLTAQSLEYSEQTRTVSAVMPERNSTAL